MQLVYAISMEKRVQPQLTGQTTDSLVTVWHLFENDIGSSDAESRCKMKEYGSSKELDIINAFIEQQGGEAIMFLVYNEADD